MAYAGQQIIPVTVGQQPTGDSLAGYLPGYNYYGTNNMGHVAFWTGFGIFAGASGLFLASIMMAKTEEVRKFSLTNFIINSIAATAYLCMAMEQGFYVRATPGGWWVYWARYIDWTFTTPLLLFDLANLAGAPPMLTYTMIFFDILMIETGLFASLSSSAWTLWLWYAFGCVAFIPIYYFVTVEFHKYKHSNVNTAYWTTSTYLAVVWTLYPIAWACGEGGEIISNDAMTVWILVLDLTAKALFGTILVYMYRDALPYAEGEISDRPVGIRKEPPMLAVSEQDNTRPFEYGLRQRTTATNGSMDVDNGMEPVVVTNQEP